MVLLGGPTSWRKAQQNGFPQKGLEVGEILFSPIILALCQYYWSIYSGQSYFIISNNFPLHRKVMSLKMFVATKELFTSPLNVAYDAPVERARKQLNYICIGPANFWALELVIISYSVTWILIFRNDPSVLLCFDFYIELFQSRIFLLRNT